MCTLLLPPTGKFGGPLSPRRKGEHSGFRLADLEFHYTPTHASWLNMVEIEIGNMNQQCLNRRISTMAYLTAELAAWQDRRNKDKARVKLNRPYEKLNQSQLN